MGRPGHRPKWILLDQPARLTLRDTDRGRDPASAVVELMETAGDNKPIDGTVQAWIRFERS